MQVSDANFPTDAQNRTYHLATPPSHLSPLILTVGALPRLTLLSALLASPSAVSNRGFTTCSGTYRGVFVSIVAIGMGCGMMDMMVREARHVLPGRMVVVRLGSCGSVGTGRVGDVSVAAAGVVVRD